MPVVEGKRNSKVHARQPGKVEKEIITRAEKKGLENICYKADVRSLIMIARDYAISKEAFITQLEEWGIAVEQRHGRIYVRDTDNPQYFFNIAKLHPSFSPEALQESFKQNMRDSAVLHMAREFKSKRLAAEAIEKAKTDFTKSLEDACNEYLQEARNAKGTTFRDFPKFYPPALPLEIKGNPEFVQKRAIAIVNGDYIRNKYAANVPVCENDNERNRSSSSSSNSSRSSEQAHHRSISRSQR